MHPPLSPTSSSRAFLERMWSRRSVLQAGLGAGAAGLAALGSTRAARAGGLSAATQAPLDPDFLLYRLVQRTSQGFARDLWDEVRLRGHANYLEWQLDALSIPDAAIDVLLQRYPSLKLSSREIQDAYVLTGRPDVPVQDLQTACVLRSVFGKRQLLERMVEFWTDHFNIDQASSECGVLKTTDDRDVIRAHALGTFPELLRASAHSGAMLFYLDNYSNQAAGVNENYARELLELHTLSPGHYTETDVRELAQVLTGWTIWRPNDAAYGTFRFRAEWHATGAYTVLGRTYGPNGGQADFERVLDQLATHPATALFLARKLCRWFLGHHVPKSVELAVAREYARTGGEIKAMLRVVLRPEHLAPAVASSKLKRPFTFVTSLLRATRAVVTDPRALLDELDVMGQAPFHWGPPDGYPDTAKYWSKSLLNRWNLAHRGAVHRRQRGERGRTLQQALRRRPARSSGHRAGPGLRQRRRRVHARRATRGARAHGLEPELPGVLSHGHASSLARLHA